MYAHTARESPLLERGPDWLASERRVLYPLLIPSALCEVESFGGWETSYPREEPLLGFWMTLSSHLDAMRNLHPALLVRDEEYDHYRNPSLTIAVHRSSSMISKCRDRSPCADLVQHRDISQQSVLSPGILGLGAI